MRGPSKTPPKYRKHRRSGQAIVTLDGKDFYLGPHGTKTSKAEYDRLVGEWLTNGRRLPVQGPAALSVSELIEAYWRFAKSYYVKNGKPTDEQASIKIALKHTRRLYGKQSVEDFGPLALEAIRNVMVERGNSRGYINKNVNRIRRMFNWGVGKQLVPADIHQALLAIEGLKRGRCTARETAPVLPVDDAVVEATLAHCSQVAADMIRFQRLTGCRPGEVRTMRAGEVDRNHEVWRFMPASHKMEHKGRSRVILIGPKAQAILLPYLLRGLDLHCFQRARGGMFERWHYNGAINSACDKAFPPPKGMGIDELKAWRKSHRWAPNRLRHSAATEVRRQHGLEAAQTVLGHKSADVTQLYAERDLEKAAKIMARVG